MEKSTLKKLNLKVFDRSYMVNQMFLLVFGFFTLTFGSKEEISMFDCEFWKTITAQLFIKISFCLQNIAYLQDVELMSFDISSPNSTCPVNCLCTTTSIRCMFQNFENGIPAFEMASEIEIL